MTKSLAELKQAVELAEKATYDLADKAPGDLIGRLIVATAEMERVIATLERRPARVN